MATAVPPLIRPVWIASYPRSGNTFVRIIFQNMFHLPTYSIYRVEGQEFHDPSADALEEAPYLPKDWRNLVSDTPEAKLTLIKTHDLPEDSAPAIFVVRDGRACIDSYFHYHKKFAFEQPSLTEVICGACQFGSWSQHYYGWQPKSRPRTLFLKYEDLVAEPSQAISSISEFLKLTPSEGRLPTFEELKARWPAFFRRGKNEDFLTQWRPEQIALFNVLHGRAMEELGYPPSLTGVSCEAIVPEVARSAAKLHERYLAELRKQGDFIARRDILTARLEKATRELATLRARRWTKLGEALRFIEPPDYSQPNGGLPEQSTSPGKANP